MIAIVNRETLKVEATYEGELDDTSNKRSYLLAEPLCKHVVVPEGLDVRFLLSDAEFNITEDSTALVNSLPTYRELRAAAYPSIGDQLDMLWHSIDNGLLGESAKTSPLYITLKSVKDAYPKE